MTPNPHREAGARERPWPPFNPGKLTDFQRSYIIAASGFYRKNEPVPFAGVNVPYQGRHSLNGLVSRGLMEERGRGFYYLTEDGWKVAWAIQGLNGRHWEQREIEEYLARGESA